MEHTQGRDPTMHRARSQTAEEAERGDGEEWRSGGGARSKSGWGEGRGSRRTSDLRAHVKVVDDNVACHVDNLRNRGVHSAEHSEVHGECLPLGCIPLSFQGRGVTMRLGL
eukprot:2566059-Rhodomonas_salina.1